MLSVAKGMDIMEKEKGWTSESVAQINYNDWSAKLAPGHEDYWANIENIARITASLLENWSTRVVADPNNSNKMICKPMKSGTIVVSQYKEKFGGPRVYCQLADETNDEEKFQQAKLSPYNKHKTIGEFRDYCYKIDLGHYRSIYFLIRQSFPQYWAVTKSNADYSELLFDTKEQYLEAMNERIETEKKYAAISGRKSNITHLESVKDVVFEICGWKEKEK